ncbi:hypothetical protein KC19_4G166700 [Ceratodon purpureus]|uniref:Secreted protein n=1 Tax=Ceratodon purpureus TaxID=3225 RepID=A0A8T0IBQ4_CERPU|nr:hypothetical protein KC19_4G166700 [Ceratodon purpureus]
MVLIRQRMCCFAAFLFLSLGFWALFCFGCNHGSLSCVKEKENPDQTTEYQRCWKLLRAKWYQSQGGTLEWEQFLPCRETTNGTICMILVQLTDDFPLNM